MKKIIIIAAVIISSAITAFAFSGKTAENKHTNNIKVETSDIAGKSSSFSGSQLASAD
ncbi:MAG: hypothetical protein ACTHNW_16700 [Mucilaginibacter sp.]